MTSKDKARLLGLLFWLFTAFNILIIVLIGIFYTAIFGLIALNPASGDKDAPPPEIIIPIIAGIFIFLTVVTILFSIPKLVAGYGLRKQKPWARGWSIAASIMACMSFPIGTAVGVFGLVFLFSDEGKQYFGIPMYAQHQFPPPSEIDRQAPPPNSWR